MHRIAAFIIIEVAVNGVSLCRPAGKGISPAGYTLVMVTALVRSTGTVQAYANKIAGDLLRREKAVKLVDTEGDPVP